MLHQANMWELWEMHPQQNLPIYFSSYMECKAACRRWMEIKRLLLLRHTLDRWRRQAATFNDLKSAADQDGKRIKPVNVCSREWRGATKWPPNPLRVCVCVCVVSVLWAKKNTIAWELYDSYIIMTVWQYIYLYIYMQWFLLNYLMWICIILFIIGNRHKRILCIYKYTNISTCTYVNILKHT